MWNATHCTGWVTRSKRPSDAHSWLKLHVGVEYVIVTSHYWSTWVFGKSGNVERCTVFLGSTNSGKLHNNNNEYLERLTRTGSKRLPVFTNTYCQICNAYIATTSSRKTLVIIIRVVVGGGGGGGVTNNNNYYNNNTAIIIIIMINLLRRYTRWKTTTNKNTNSLCWTLPQIGYKGTVYLPQIGYKGTVYLPQIGYKGTVYLTQIGCKGTVIHAATLKHSNPAHSTLLHSVFTTSVRSNLYTPLIAVHSTAVRNRVTKTVSEKQLLRNNSAARQSVQLREPSSTSLLFVSPGL